MKNIVLWTGVFLAALTPLVFPVPTWSSANPGGVEGLAAFRGDFVAGAVILAFKEPGPGPEAVPLAVSRPTESDGRYRLLLSPGKYYLMAVRTTKGSWPARLSQGDLFCYYLGNPIVVEPGGMTRVGFNMVQVTVETASTGGTGSGIAGKIIFEDHPLGRAYVYVYRETATNFRGMGLAALPTDEKGEFRLKLPLGRYYFLARKRREGGIYGPPQKDDYIGYYWGNPVEVRGGEFRTIILETTTRVDLLEELWFREGSGAGWFQGVVVDSRERPVAGLYILFYDGYEIVGTPAFVAGPTDLEGRFKVRAAAGSYRILARGSLGGPPEEGEWYGKYRDPGGEEEVEATSGKEIHITVERYYAP